MLIAAFLAIYSIYATYAKTYANWCRITLHPSE